MAKDGLIAALDQQQNEITDIKNQYFVMSTAN